MYVSMFDLRVDGISVTDLAVTLRLTDSDGNGLNLFFKDLNEVKQFSRSIRRAVLDEADKQYNEFDRPALITDVTRKGV